VKPSPVSTRRLLPVSTGLLVLAAVAALALAALVAASPAAAKTEKSCARQIIEDWYDNQRVDKFYPLHCYHEAIDSLGPDAKNYTNLPEAILRALAYRQANEADPGENGAANGKSGVKPVAYRHTSDLVLAVGDGGTTAAPASGAGDPSSVPIPLIVLAGLAGLLLIAGGAGYVARRVQGRRGGPPPEE
jgi:hypothetical protein